MSSLLIAQISDTHLEADIKDEAQSLRTQKAFDALIMSIQAQPVKPDLILFSGDLGEAATHAEYSYVAAGLDKLGIPVLAIPGNHDARAPMRDMLPTMIGQTYSGHLCLCNADFPLVIIGLDTLTEGAPHGELCPARLEWLSQKLSKYSDRDALIFMHHPPITTGMQHMDSMGLLEGKQEFANLVRQHGKVQAILCGHMHRSITGKCGGASVRVSPSASRQIACDLREQEPYRFTSEPPQYMLHLYTPEDGLVSHIVPVTSD